MNLKQYLIDTEVEYVETLTFKEQVRYWIKKAKELL